MVTTLVTTEAENGLENGLEEDGIHRLRCLPLHAWEDMRVDPQGSGDVLVPEGL